MTSEKKFENGEETMAQAGPSGQPQEPLKDQASGSGSTQEGAATGNDEVGQLKAEVADLKDRLLRVHAEMDNVRKRLEREKADQAKFAITKFARDIVAVGDNVQRAIDAVPHRTVEQDAALKSFFEGVTMIERELLTVLGRHGIKRLDPNGEPFDPHRHQAVVEVPSEEVPAGRVTQVFQSGYMIEDRVLRPAMVAVSKGGAKPPAPAEAVGSAVPPSANGSQGPTAEEPRDQPTGESGDQGGASG